MSFHLATVLSYGVTYGKVCFLVLVRDFFKSGVLFWLHYPLCHMLLFENKFKDKRSLLKK